MTKSDQQSIFLFMANIKIIKESKLKTNEAFEQIKSVLSDDPELKKLDSSYKCEFDDASLSGRAKGSKFEANLEVKEKGEGSEVSLEVKLPLLLRPFKSVVESTLTKKMEKVLS